MNRKLQLLVFLLLCHTPVYPIMVVERCGWPDQAAIAEMIRDLGDSQYVVRRAAAQKLREAGYVAIPALQKAAKSDDPEVAVTARELLPDASAILQLREQFIDAGLKSLQADWGERRYEKMLAEATLFTAAVDDDARLPYLKAMALSALDRDAEAEELVKKALTLNPEDKVAHYSAGEMLMDLEQYDLAEGEWLRILEILPEAGVYEMNAHLRLGRITARRKDYAAAARHFGTVLQTLRDGTTQGALVGMNLEEMEIMVRDLEARAAAQAAGGSNKSGIELEVEISATLKDARTADLLQALDAAVATLRLKVEPAGFRIADIQHFVLRYDPEGKEASFYLGGSAVGKPFQLEFEEETVSVAVSQLDVVYFYNVSRKGGQGELVARFDFDFDVQIKAGERIRDYTSSGVKVGSRTIAWKELQEGVRMDWLPEPFEIELEGISPQGSKDKFHYTLPPFLDVRAWANSLPAEHDEPDQ